MFQLFINIIVSALLLIILAYSIILRYYPTRYFNISHAALFTYSAYFFYLFYIQINLNIIISFCVAIIATSCLSLLSEICIFKQLRKLKCSSMNIMISSLGLYIILQNIISIIWGDDTKSLATTEFEIGHKILDAHITDIQFYIILICIILCVGVIILLNKFSLGRKIRAIASNKELTDILGISSENVILSTTLIGSILISIVGLLVSFNSILSPTMGFNWFLYGTVVVIIGGIGNGYSIFFSSLILVSLQHIITYYLGSQWMDVATYLILITFLIIKPYGLSGNKLKKIEL